jgi:hypothetical protein
MGHCRLSGEGQHERVAAMHATFNVTAYVSSVSLTPLLGFWIGEKG